MTTDNKVLNRHGQDVELSTISKIEWSDDFCFISRKDGWGQFGLATDELDGFVPQVGDAIVVFTTNFSFVRGVIIENHVVRYHTAAEVEAENKAMVDGFRLNRLEEYVRNGDELKRRVSNLTAPLRDRMYRFADEGGIEFWIERAPYEMACLEGAHSLIRKVGELGFDSSSSQGAIDWINEWWNKPYKEQMEIVPDFGSDHSGTTASAAVMMAIDVLEGKSI